MAVDSSGNGYITGADVLPDLPLSANAPFTTWEGSGNTPATSNAFVAEFNPNQAGSVPNIASLLYGTYLGGHGGTDNFTLPVVGAETLNIGDIGTGIQVDPSTGIWVAGVTGSTDFQKIPGNLGVSFQSFNEAGSRHDCTLNTANPPATAAFVMQLNPSLVGTNQVRYSMYFGGCGIQFDLTPIFGMGTIGFGDAATGIQVIGGKVYLTGVTTGRTMGANDFPLSANALACNTPFRLDENQSAGISFGKC